MFDRKAYMKEYNKKYKKEHKEELREMYKAYNKSKKGKEAHKKYYETHKEKCIEMVVDYKKRNKNKVDKWNKKYRDDHSNEIKEINRKYYKNHRNKGIIIWEQHYGEIPEGCLLIHKDKNKKNNDLDNLVLITKAEYGTMCLNTIGISENKDITETNILIARLMNKKRKIEKGEQAI